MPLPRIRVHLVSSRVLIRSGLSALLRVQPQIQLAGESASWSDTSQADLVLWDAHDANPHSLPVPFLVLLSDSKPALAWLDAGARGIVLESSATEQLLDAIRQTARGEVYLPPELAQQVNASLGDEVPPHTLLVEPLTDREREVLRFLGQGLSNKSIAQKLYLSVRTVEGHLANIYGKLQVKSRTEATLWATHNLWDER
jgi:two-component system nitrate/nitrite response regulator NarL